MNLDHKRILIVKPSSLGDVVHTLPLVHAIKRSYPLSYISWIVQKSFTDVVTADPAVDEIIPISIPSTSDPNAARGALLSAFAATVREWRQLRRRLDQNPCDLVLDLHASFRSGLLGLANPDGLRIGFAHARELNTLFQQEFVHPDPGKPHAVDQNLAFAEYLCVDVLPQDFRVVIDPSARERVRSFLTEAGITERDGIIYANPAARWATKLWTAEGWARLGDLLVSKTGARVVFAGGPGDVPLIQSIMDRMKEKALNSAGKLSLAEAAALLEAAVVYVGVDSGPMHIAAFVGTPVVALFGPTDPAKVGPYGTGNKVVRREDLDCLACRKRACPDRKCLEDIRPEEVFEEVVRMVAREK